MESIPHFEVKWLDGKREAKCKPDLAYPKGIDLDVSDGREKTCIVPLPYPAPRCGVHILSCLECGLRIAVTAAGRPDDPVSVKLPCRSKPA